MEGEKDHTGRIRNRMEGDGSRRLNRKEETWKGMEGD
jgi:hypothetical protein